MLRSIVDYIYVNCFQWSTKVNGKDYFNRFSASMMLTLLIVINFGSLAFILSALTGKKLPASNDFKVIFLIAVIALLASIYRYFSRENRHSKLMEYYESNQRMQNRNSFVVGLLALGSLSLLLFVWFLGLMLADSNL